ncbi:hypothetical protein L207DRAFT_518770, partial [Hyaloscypha variabilis F]
MSGYAASAYAWRTVSAYRLSQSDLDKFLVGIFGNVNLFIRHKIDNFEFWAPRDLTQVNRHTC